MLTSTKQNQVEVSEIRNILMVMGRHRLSPREHADEQGSVRILLEHCTTLRRLTDTKSGTRGLSAQSSDIAPEELAEGNPDRTERTGRARRRKLPRKEREATACAWRGRQHRMTTDALC